MNRIDLDRGGDSLLYKLGFASLSSMLLCCWEPGGRSGQPCSAALSLKHTSLTSRFMISKLEWRIWDVRARNLGLKISLYLHIFRR